MDKRQEIFGDYVVQEKLGSGGMATVHRAIYDRGDGTSHRVALKRLKADARADAELVQHFMVEAQLASRFSHPNLVQVFDFGEIEDSHYIAMELLSGMDLGEILRRVASMPMASTPVGVVISIMRQLCDGLSYAHAGQDLTGRTLAVTHRDIAPSNLFLTRKGVLKIIDFGIAGDDESRDADDSGRIKGKIRYMTPEALDGNRLDARSDIYAAGIVLYELLTARHLFDGLGRDELIPPPSLHNASCPSPLDDIVLKALARDPNERFQSALEFGQALEAFGRSYLYSTDVVKAWFSQLRGSCPEVKAVPMSLGIPDVGGEAAQCVEYSDFMVDEDSEVLDLETLGQPESFEVSITQEFEPDPTFIEPLRCRPSGTIQPSDEIEASDISVVRTGLWVRPPKLPTLARPGRGGKNASRISFRRPRRP